MELCTFCFGNAQKWRKERWKERWKEVGIYVLLTSSINQKCVILSKILEMSTFAWTAKQWSDSARKQKTGSHLDRSPSGMMRFMNHVDGVETGPYSTSTQRQTVIVCMCICVWWESLLCAGPCLCVFARSRAANTFTQPPRSLLFLNYGFCCNLTAKTWGKGIIMPQKAFLIRDYFFFFSISKWSNDVWAFNLRDDLHITARVPSFFGIT